MSVGAGCRAFVEISHSRARRYPSLSLGLSFAYCTDGIGARVESHFYFVIHSRLQVASNITNLRLPPVSCCRPVLSLSVTMTMAVEWVGEISNSPQRHRCFRCHEGEL